MEALTCTPTKILAKLHAFSSSSRSWSTVSRRRETCLSKSLNGAACLGFVSSRSEVRLEADAANTKTPQKDESKVASLRLELKKECQYGQQLLVVGDDPILGSWNPLNAAPLNWSDGHRWTVDLELPSGKTIYYKFICKLSTGDIDWQPGSDRTVQLTERQNVVIITEDWGNAEAEKIIKQEKPNADNPETKSSDPFGCISFSDNKFMATTENSSNSSGSAKAAYIGDDTPVTHRNMENSGATDVKREPCINTTEMKEELPARKSNEKTDEEGLVIYDEGCVLVPGLTLQVITEEALAKELKNTILVSALTAQMITEEALGKEMQKPVLDNTLTEADKASEEDVEETMQCYTA